MNRLSGITSLTVLAVIFVCKLSIAGWSDPVRISEPGGCVYPQILTHGDTLHVVYTNGSGGHYVGYVRSVDGGDIWSDPIILCDTNRTDGGLFVRICCLGEKIMVIWRDTDYGIYMYNIGYVISYDGGLNWGTPRYIFSSNWEDIFYYSAQSSDSIINIIFNSSSPPDLFFYSIRSTDFGGSWSAPAEQFRAVQSGRPDMAGYGNLIHFVWPGRFSTEEHAEIYYMRSLDGGITWSPNAPLSDTDEFHSQLPAIAAGDAGRVGVTWMDFKYAPFGVTGDIFLRLSADSGSTWSAENQLTFDHNAYRSDLVLDSDTVQVIWEDASLGMAARYIDYIKSTDNGASWSEPYWVDRTEDDSWNPAMDISNGKVYVVWVDAGYVSGMGVYFSKYQDPTDVIDEEQSLPVQAGLRAYPNPFNSITVISYTNLDGSDAIDILNILGQVVRTFNIQNRKEGQVIWDGTDTGGSPMASGVYLIKATASPDSRGVKLLYLK